MKRYLVELVPFAALGIVLSYWPGLSTLEVGGVIALVLVARSISDFAKEQVGS